MIKWNGASEAGLQKSIERITFNIEFVCIKATKFSSITLYSADSLEKLSKRINSMDI